MKFSQLAAQRYSVRRFDSRPVEQAVLDQILETGRLAPTAKNMQPQRIYVVRSEVLLAKLRAITAMTFDAPQVLIICADQSEAWVNPFNGPQFSGNGRVNRCRTHDAADAGAGNWQHLGLLVRHGKGKADAGPAGKR